MRNENIEIYKGIEILWDDERGGWLVEGNEYRTFYSIASARDFISEEIVWLAPGDAGG